MQAAYFLMLVFYFTVTATVCCLTLIFILLRAAGAYRTGRRSRLFYVVKATLAVSLWVGLSALTFYVPFLRGADSTGRLGQVILMSGTAVGYFASGKLLLYFVSRRETDSRRLHASNALRAR